jgi:hypothetical protein
MGERDSLQNGISLLIEEETFEAFSSARQLQCAYGLTTWVFSGSSSAHPAEKSDALLLLG